MRAGCTGSTVPGWPRDLSSGATARVGHEAPGQVRDRVARDRVARGGEPRT